MRFARTIDWFIYPSKCEDNPVRILVRPDRGDDVIIDLSMGEFSEFCKTVDNARKELLEP